MKPAGMVYFLKAVGAGGVCLEGREGGEADSQKRSRARSTGDKITRDILSTT